MHVDAPKSFKAHLKALREAAGYTPEELATIAGLSVHAVSALERDRIRDGIPLFRMPPSSSTWTSAEVDRLLHNDLHS